MSSENKSPTISITKPTPNDDFDCVLQLARDEIEHLRRDAKHDEDSAADYRDSKAALDRVVERFENTDTVITEKED